MIQKMTDERLRKIEAIYHFPGIDTYPGELIAEIKRLKNELQSVQKEIKGLRRERDEARSKAEDARKELDELEEFLSNNSGGRITVNRG